MAVLGIDVVSILLMCLIYVHRLCLIRTEFGFVGVLLCKSLLLIVVTSFSE